MDMINIVVGLILMGVLQRLILKGVDTIAIGTTKVLKAVEDLDKEETK